MKCITAAACLSIVHGSEQASLLQSLNLMAGLEEEGQKAEVHQHSALEQNIQDDITDIQSPPILLPTLDFSGTIEVPRHVRQTGWMFEMMATIPMAENGITVKMKEVVPALPRMPVLTFPLNHQITGAEAVRSTLGGRHEYGHLRWVGDKMNPKMGAVPGSSLGFSERFQIYSHEGAWPTTDLEAIRAVQNSAHATQLKAAAALHRENRTKAALAFAAGSMHAWAWIHATQDPATMMALEAYITNHGPATSAEFAAAAAKMQMLKSSADATPSSISTSCLHTLDHPLLTVTDEYFEVPLHVNLGAFRGQAEFSPQQSMSFATGKQFWSVNQETGHLIWYMAAGSYGEVNVPTAVSTTKPMYSGSAGFNVATYVGPVDGVSLASSQNADLRHLNPKIAGINALIANDAHKAYFGNLLNQYTKAPVDYTYLYSDMDKACPSSTRHGSLKTEAAAMDFAAMSSDGDGMTTAEKVSFIDHSMNVLPCAMHFLKGAEDQSNGVDLLESVVFMHFMMEWPAWKRVHAILGNEDKSIGWDWDRASTSG